MEGEGEIARDVADTSLVEVSKSRLRVLKALKGTRRTVSELARELDLTKSTLHGHLQDLLEDGLVRRHEEEDRLWVYYSLSEVGEALVSRDRLTLVVDLGTIAAFLTSAALALDRLMNPPPPTGGPGTLGGPEPDPGTPWFAIAYAVLVGLVVLGVALHAWLRRRPVAAEGGPA
jgi:DNA-binding transcriptional ArsR family regulator